MPSKKITKIRDVGIGQNLQSYLTDCESTNEQMSTEVFLSDSDSPVSSIYGPSTIRLTHSYIITGVTSNFNPNINLIERIQYLEKRLGIKNELDIVENDIWTSEEKTEDKAKLKARIEYAKTHPKKYKKTYGEKKVIETVKKSENPVEPKNSVEPENSIGYLEI